MAWCDVVTICPMAISCTEPRRVGKMCGEGQPHDGVGHPPKAKSQTVTCQSLKGNERRGPRDPLQVHAGESGERHWVKQRHFGGVLDGRAALRAKPFSKDSWSLLLRRVNGSTKDSPKAKLDPKCQFLRFSSLDLCRGPLGIQQSTEDIPLGTKALPNLFANNLGKEFLPGPSVWIFLELLLHTQRTHGITKSNSSAIKLGR